MTYYQAKFLREQKPIPSDWLIVPENGLFALIYIGDL